MIPLLSETGLRELEAQRVKMGLYAFDFDGTLAPIVDDPKQAKCPEVVEAFLQRLQKSAKIAIISGRSIEDLKSKFNFLPDYLIGNHGLEGLSASDQLEQMAAVCAKWKLQWLEIQAWSNDSGILLEDKVYSLALHYRGTVNEAERAQKIRQLLSSLSPPPRIIGGKWVLNLLPDSSGNKGVALQSLMDQSGARGAFYIGDDETDEDVFDLKDSRIFGVRIGIRPGSHAQYYLDSQAQG